MSDHTRDLGDEPAVVLKARIASAQRDHLAAQRAHRAEVTRRERAEAKVVVHTLLASTLGVLVGAWGQSLFGWLG